MTPEGRARAWAIFADVLARNADGGTLCENVTKDALRLALDAALAVVGEPQEEKVCTHRVRRPEYKSPHPLGCAFNETVGRWFVVGGCGYYHGQEPTDKPGTTAASSLRPSGHGVYREVLSRLRGLANGRATAGTLASVSLNELTAALTAADAAAKGTAPLFTPALHEFTMRHGQCLLGVYCECASALLARLTSADAAAAALPPCPGLYRGGTYYHCPGCPRCPAAGTP